jgi:hypothetical protein
MNQQAPPPLLSGPATPVLASHSVAGGQWVEDEFNHSRFRDLRIRKRVYRFVQQLAEHIGAPIPNACQDWANTKAAYRLLSNPRLTEEEILDGHFHATAGRSDAADGTILILHDTTEFSVRRDDPSPVGKIKSLRCGRSYATPHVTTCGVLLHSSLAITENGLPLGLCAAKFWTRKEFKGTNALKRHVNPTRIPIEEKESVRWIENLRASTRLLGAPERCLHIGDRESDIYELFCAAQEEGTHFLVRTFVDRRSGPTRRCISEQMSGICPQGQHRITVPDQDGNPTEAVLEIKYQRLLLHPPEGKQRKYPTLMVTAIHAYETRPPANRERIDWKLLTDLPVDDAKAAIQLLEKYSMRWKIEVFHKILKSGCRAEQSHLRTADRLTNLFAFFCIIAWRIFWLTMSQRKDKDAPPSLVFTETEQLLLDHFVKDRPSETCTPTLQYYLRKVAILRGYLARKHDSPPGNIVIWRGFRKLHDLHAGFLAARQIVGN